MVPDAHDDDDKAIAALFSGPIDWDCCWILISPSGRGSDTSRLSDAARKLIADTANEVFISVARLWHIAIKFSGDRDRPNSVPIGSEAAQAYFLAAGYKLVDIAATHVHALKNLPPVDSDPCDRILLAQAYEMPLRLLTHDQILPLIWR